jgi:membrane-bound inhibitor of C-type lysozyme
VISKIIASLAPLALSQDEIEAECHTLWPALVAMKRRDMLYQCAREFVTPGHFQAHNFLFEIAMKALSPAQRFDYRVIIVVFSRAVHR